MNQLRALMIDASEYSTSRLLAEWHGLVPEFATPPFMSAFGDWVFGHPDGGLWILSEASSRRQTDSLTGQ
jgi:hypothetical protein